MFRSSKACSLCVHTNCSRFLAFMVSGQHPTVTTAHKSFQAALKSRCMQDLLLAILVEQEPIKLAPSSSQIPALLAKTKQNIFDVRAQQQASHRYQQRFQQQRPGSGATANRDAVMGDSLRRDSQVSAPGQPSLLATASGVNLAGDGPQDNAPQQGEPMLDLPAPMWGSDSM